MWGGRPRAAFLASALSCLAVLAASRKHPHVPTDLPLIAHLSREHALAFQQEMISAPASPPIGAVRDEDGGMEIDLFMPQADAIKEDTYLCHSVQLPPEKLMVIKVRAVVDVTVVEEVMVYGCRAPHTDTTQGWVCDSPGTRCSARDEEDGLRLIYGWTRGSQTLDLPENIGFEVGWGSPSPWIVMEVRYKDVTVKDMSGVRLTLKSEVKLQDKGDLKRGERLKPAGNVNFISHAPIPTVNGPRKISFACCYGGTQPLQTFASRVHAHALEIGASLEKVGMEGYGFLDPAGRAAPRHSTVVVKRDFSNPQALQLHPRGVRGGALEKNLTVLPGETLKATCDFSPSSRPEAFEEGNHRETCSIRALYWASSSVDMTCGEGSHVMYGARPEDEVPPGRSTALVDWGQGFSRAELGPVGGVGQDSAGNIVVLHRGRGRVQVPGPNATKEDTVPERFWNETGWTWGTRPLEYLMNNEATFQASPIGEDLVVFLDPDSGEPLAGGANAWGRNQFYMPHSLTVDAEDNVWVADLARHQVMKYQRDGTPLLEVGTLLQRGDNETHLCMPTAVAVASGGAFYVADGMCNHRIVVYNRAGEYQREIIRYNRRMSYAAPHDLVLDECAGVLLVADRENGEVVAIDTSTDKELFSWNLKEHGAVYALARSPAGSLFALTRPHLVNHDVAGAGPRILLLTPHSRGRYSSKVRPGVEQVWQPPSLVSPHSLHITTGFNHSGVNIFVGDIRPWDKWARPPVHKLSVVVNDPGSVEPEFVGLKHRSNGAWAGLGGPGGGEADHGVHWNIFTLHHSYPQLVAVASGAVVGVVAWLVWGITLRGRRGEGAGDGDGGEGGAGGEKAGGVGGADE